MSTNSRPIAVNTNDGRTVEVTSADGSVTFGGGSGSATARFNTTTVISGSQAASGFASPTSVDGSLNVGVNVALPNSPMTNIGQVTFSPNGISPTLNTNAAFNALPQGLQTVIGAGGIDLAKNSITGAFTDLGLKNATPAAAGAAAAAADAVQGAVGAVAAPSPGGAAAAAAGGGGGLRYPKDMVSAQDQIMFTSEEGKSVILGIQPQISDSNAVEWGGSSLNEIQKQLVNIARGAINPNTDLSGYLARLPGQLAIEGKKLLKNPDANSLVKNWFIEQALGLQGLSARDNGNQAGVILNPNLELVFTGPTLRPFTFTFRMTSREKAESDNIRKIIRFFKETMAPRKSGTYALKRPQYFKITYMGKAADSGSLNKIKDKCALTNCSVDYTPDGSYMTYQDDGAMTAYNLTLQFQEIEPVYDEDYKKVPADHIGY